MRISDWSSDVCSSDLAAGKSKQRDGEDGLTLERARTRDILADVANHARRPRLVVGFAAETGDVEANARAKLAKKKLDLIAANRVGVEGSGFESDDNALVVYWNDGQRA